MATKREYLVGLGLAKPGRGRFSREALAKIAEAEANGIVFDEPVVSKPTPHPTPSEKVVSQEGDSPPSPPSPKPEPPVVVPAREPQKKVRHVGSLYGYTPEGFRVNFATCRKCAQHIDFCKCKPGPLAPTIVATLDDDSIAVVG